MPAVLPVWPNKTFKFLSMLITGQYPAGFFMVVYLLEKERKERKKKEKLRKQQKAPHINKGKGATWEEKPLYQKSKGGSVRIRRVAGRQASRPLLIGLRWGECSRERLVWTSL